MLDGHELDIGRVGVERTEDVADDPLLLDVPQDLVGRAPPPFEVVEDLAGDLLDDLACRRRPGKLVERELHLIGAGEVTIEVLATELLEDLVHEAAPMAGLELVDIPDVVLLAHVQHLLEEVARRAACPRLQRSGRQQRVGDRELRVLADVAFPFTERVVRSGCEGVEPTRELWVRGDDGVPCERCGGHEAELAEIALVQRRGRAARSGQLHVERLDRGPSFLGHVRKPGRGMCDLPSGSTRGEQPPMRSRSDRCEIRASLISRPSLRREG